MGVARGFTLLELLVVMAIVVMATSGVALALRDNSDTQLEREGERLAALLESARAQSRATGRVVRWRATPDGFEFEGLAAGSLPDRWLGQGITADRETRLILGPEPVIGPQSVVLQTGTPPARQLRVGTDGLRPFRVQVSAP